MATTLTLPASLEVQAERQTTSEHRFGVVLVTVLTGFALAIHGYHPYAEDGGIYLAGVERLLNPALYPHWSEFVTEHQRFSVFAPIIATLVRTSHLPLMTVWLLLYVASFWLTLYAAWLLASRCYLGREARCGAVTLLAAWLTLPVAGTSLMLMDPYLSARSISTPCALLALVGVLDLFASTAGDRTSRTRALALCCSAIIVAALVHPLMAAYALGCVLLLACQLSKSRSIRVGTTAALSCLAFLVAAIIYKGAPPETPTYLNVALTRTYWFVARWQWHEQFGLVAPLAILAFIGSRGRDTAAAVARIGAVAGTVAVVVAVTFARSTAPTYLVARLQPLRMFQIVYLLMILAVGAVLGEKLLRRSTVRWAVSVALLGAMTLYAGHITFPSSSHLELPWNEPGNNWERAFVWVRTNTPVDALFALDAHYVTHPGEDAQTFRALAERSALPDYSKDGGEASITPDLAPAWATGQTAQTGLNTATDAARIAALRPLRVDWIVLPASSPTRFACNYTDEAVKVCRLPWP